MLVKRGSRCHVRAKIQTVEYALGLVNAGVGCALLPDLPPLLAHQDICFRPLAGIELTRTIGLAYVPMESPPVAFKRLLPICQQQ